MFERIARTTAVAAIVAFGGATGAVTAPPPAVALTFPDETPFDQAKFEAAQAANKPILIHITAAWCSICATQKKILGDLLKEEKFKPLVVFNVDFDSQKDLVRKFGARAQSTMVVFKGQKEAGIFSGDTRPKAVALLLSRAF